MTFAKVLYRPIQGVPTQYKIYNTVNEQGNSESSSYTVQENVWKLIVNTYKGSLNSATE